MQTVLVTGSTDGIGKATAMVLAEKGFNVIVHGKNRKKGEEVVDEIIEKSGNRNITLKIADLTSLKEVKKLADSLKNDYKKLDVLINNAGIYSIKRQLTRDGLEATFAVNHLAHFLLTNLVLDLILKSVDGRIINVSSMIHASSIDFNNFQGERYYDASYAYSLSKLCNVLFTYKLAEKLKGSNVTVNCLHPGVINTKLLRAGWGGGGSSVKQGAKTSIYLATSEDVSGVTGNYFMHMKAVKSQDITYDKEVQDKCWNISLNLVKGYMV